jgi:hypothetical protein
VDSFVLAADMLVCDLMDTRHHPNGRVWSNRAACAAHTAGASTTTAALGAQAQVFTHDTGDGITTLPTNLVTQGAAEANVTLGRYATELVRSMAQTVAGPRSSPPRPR